MSSALIVVDVQKDFCEGGKLAVAGGNKVALDIANYIEFLGGLYQEIVYTKDWHNPLPDTNGGHFSTHPDFVDSWPVHCVANTDGAQFNDDLYSAIMWDTIRRDKRPPEIFYKGQGKPDYSGFQGYNTHNESLAYWLSKRHILNVDIVGIAGDYCVKHTALDAHRLGFLTNILPTLVASVKGQDGTQEALMALSREPV